MVGNLVAQARRCPDWAVFPSPKDLPKDLGNFENSEFGDGVFIATESDNSGERAPSLWKQHVGLISNLMQE